MLFPESSAGLLYDVMTHHLGFRQGDEGKTMGLAPYGGPELFAELAPRLKLSADGSFTFMAAEELYARLAEYVPERAPGAPMLPRHQHVAFAAQALLESIVTNAFAAAVKVTGRRRLAYAGGVALNSVANHLAAIRAGLDDLYVAPNAGDTGHALGCALMGAYEFGGWPPPAAETPEYLGPPYGDRAIEEAGRACGLPMTRPRDLPAELAAHIANGWITARFDGPAEFGPRALGNRSILCDPRRPGMVAHLNDRVKHREPFRPFAPTVLLEHAPAWFDLSAASRYMLRVARIRPEMQARIPAVVHVDGTGRVQTLTRVQNPGFWPVVHAFFERTGVPVLLNTSFNVAGRPIVETPADAVACFTSTEIDVLALGPFLLTKPPRP
jgi:carbamoyltransferase